MKNSLSLKRNKKIIACVALVISSTPASAWSNKTISKPVESYPKGRPTLACTYQAAKTQGVPFPVLLGVNSSEMGTPGKDMSNTNSTVDTGSFQINSIHYERARKMGIPDRELSSRGCLNAEFAAILLYEAINHPRKKSLDFFTRASGYHSWTPRHNKKYRTNLIKYTREWENWLSSTTGSRRDFF